MAEQKHLVERAYLSQLVFELYRGIGQDSDGYTCVEKLLRSIPSLPRQSSEEILDRIKIASAEAACSMYHPGLVPLVSCQSCRPRLDSYLLHDTLILDISETIEGRPISQFQQSLITPSASLGRCNLLIVVTEDVSDDHAKGYCLAALGITPETLVQTRKAILKGSPIWEFSDGFISHYVWLVSKRPPLESGDIDLIFDLLCARIKIDYLVRTAADSFAQGKVHYANIETRLRDISLLSLGLSDPAERKQRIDILESHLSYLPHYSYMLAGCERDMDTQLLGIQDNVANAKNCCKQLLLEGDTFLCDDFLLQECAMHQRQIQHDLRVLAPGRRYADQAIDAIRVMVTIDSQKQQVELEQRENAREQSLRKTLTIVGSGLSISGLAAQSRSRPTEEILKRTEQTLSIQALDASNPFYSASLWISDIGIYASMGIMAAFLVYLGLRLAGKWNLAGKLFR